MTSIHFFTVEKCFSVYENRPVFNLFSFNFNFNISFSIFYDFIHTYFFNFKWIEYLIPLLHTCINVLCYRGGIIHRMRMRI